MPLLRRMVNLSAEDDRLIRGRMIATQQSYAAVVREAIRALFRPDPPNP